MGSSAVLVTGSGTRLGSLFARHMAGLGFDLALHCNSSVDGAKKLVDDLTALGCDCEIFTQDFLQPFDATDFIAKVKERFPHFNCLINNASAYEAAPAKTTDRQLLESQFRVNFFTPYLLASGFAQQVSEGQIINILDNKIAYHQYQYSAYLLSKKTLANFTQMAALEFAPQIRVNGISPGVTLPGETRGDVYVNWRIEGIPLKRKGADANLMMALDYLLNNAFVTGQTLTVDGGETVNNVGRNAENFSDVP
ncbi:MAG: SDR family NAD(P)-dependent oxidoreductase [Pseudomonadales bacterium]|nr:SDR family NAD(P)-dependent oxidoreductase [Pseudomonadales bacterium]